MYRFYTTQPEINLEKIMIADKNEIHHIGD